MTAASNTIPRRRWHTLFNPGEKPPPQGIPIAIFRHPRPKPDS